MPVIALESIRPMLQPPPPQAPALPALASLFPYPGNTSNGQRKTRPSQSDALLLGILDNFRSMTPSCHEIESGTLEGEDGDDGESGEDSSSFRDASSKNQWTSTGIGGNNPTATWIAHDGIGHERIATSGGVSPGRYPIIRHMSLCGMACYEAPGTINGVPVNALPDTGSSVDAISEDFAKLHGWSRKCRGRRR